MNERPYVNVQVRLPRDIHMLLTNVADEHHRSLHGELLHVASTWVRLPETERIEFDRIAQQQRPPQP